jgi:chromate transport protein ChrA
VQNFPDWKSVVLCAAAFVSVKYLKVHPIMMIIIAGVIGYFFFKPTPIEETQQLVQLLGAR